MKLIIVLNLILLRLYKSSADFYLSIAELLYKLFSLYSSFCNCKVLDKFLCSKYIRSKNEAVDNLKECLFSREMQACIIYELSQC